MDLRRVYREMNTCTSVLDIGTGHGPIIGLIRGPDRRVGIDACEKAIVTARRRRPEVDFRVCDVKQIADMFGPDEFEGIIGFDILEHLAKDDTLALLKACELIASKMLWWFVPIGDHKQEFDPRNEGNEELQTHRSIWRPEEFVALGYRVWYFDDWHMNHSVRHTNKSTEAALCRKMLDADEHAGELIVCHRFR